MIIIDLMEYVGKNVRLYFIDGSIREGRLEYIPSYSEVFNYKRPKHFYINDYGFRSYNVEKAEEIEG